MSLSIAPYIIASHALFFREGDSVSSTNTTATRSRNTNVATITTPTAHGLFTGATVNLTGLGGTGYNQTGVTVTVVDATTFTYANTGANEGQTADTGGTVTLSGTCAREFKPGINDANWVNLGVIEDATDSIEPGEAKEVWKPSPGKLILYDIIRIKPKLSFKFTCGELGPFHLETMYRTLKLTNASTQFNPMEGVAKKGWLKLQRYDHNDNLRMVLDHWVELSISGELNMGGQDIVKPQFEAVGLYSSLNSGSI